MLICRVKRPIPTRRIGGSSRFSSIPTPPRRATPTAPVTSPPISSSAAPKKSKVPMLATLGLGIAFPLALLYSKDFREMLLPPSALQGFNTLVIQRKDLPPPKTTPPVAVVLSAAPIFSVSDNAPPSSSPTFASSSSLSSPPSPPSPPVVDVPPPSSNTELAPKTEPAIAVEEAKEEVLDITVIEGPIVAVIRAEEEVAESHSTVDSGKTAEEVEGAVKEAEAPQISLVKAQMDVFKAVMELQGGQIEPTLAAVVEKQVAAAEETLDSKLADIRSEVNSYLNELIKQKSTASEVKAEFGALLQQAEAKSREEFVNALMVQAKDLQGKLNDSVHGLIQDALVKQDALIAEFLEYAIEERVKEAAAVIRAEYEHEKQERIADLHALKVEAKAFENVVAGHSQYQLSADKLLQLSTALIAVNQSLANSQPFDSAWKVLRDASVGDDLLTLAVSMVPEAVASHGAMSIPVLKQGFRRVERAGCTASFLPPDPSFYGHLLAQVFSFLTLRERELVDGADDHACLSRAGYFMKKGDLSRVLTELDQLSPAVKQVCLDWQHEATERLVLDQSLDLIRSRIKTLRMALE